MEAVDLSRGVSVPLPSPVSQEELSQTWKQHLASAGEMSWNAVLAFCALKGSAPRADPESALKRSLRNRKVALLAVTAFALLGTAYFLYRSEFWITSAGSNQPRENIAALTPVSTPVASVNKPPLTQDHTHHIPLEECYPAMVKISAAALTAVLGAAYNIISDKT